MDRVCACAAGARQDTEITTTIEVKKYFTVHL
jgi:hypothetical protein